MKCKRMNYIQPMATRYSAEQCWRAPFTVGQVFYERLDLQAGSLTSTTSLATLADHFNHPGTLMLEHAHAHNAVYPIQDAQVFRNRVSSRYHSTSHLLPIRSPQPANITQALTGMVIGYVGARWVKGQPRASFQATTVPGDLSGF